MLADPEQTRDISAQKPEMASQLAEAAARWKEELLPGLRDDKRPFPVGHREFPVTQLPARDGVPHGNVRRSARAPNCSYFTNWKSADDRITWDIEVATPGRYEAVVYYTCAAKDVGSKVELAFQQSRLEAKVSEAHDPPLYGDNHDLASRGSESLVKDFKPLSLGTIELPRGRGELALRTLDVAGEQVMDVRLILLTLKND
jgi:hypothetical protein